MHHLSDDTQPRAKTQPVLPASSRTRCYRPGVRAQLQCDRTRAKVVVGPPSVPARSPVRGKCPEGVGSDIAIGAASAAGVVVGCAVVIAVAVAVVALVAAVVIAVAVAVVALVAAAATVVGPATVLAGSAVIVASAARVTPVAAVTVFAESFRLGRALPTHTNNGSVAEIIIRST